MYSNKDEPEKLGEPHLVYTLALTNLVLANVEHHAQRQRCSGKPNVVYFNCTLQRSMESLAQLNNGL